jgi:hypothetical protein
LGERLFKRILRSGRTSQAAGMMMEVRVARNSGGLQILLDGGVVLLSSGELAGFEIGGQLIEGGSEVVRRGRRGKARDVVGLNGVKSD